MKDTWMKGNENLVPVAGHLACPKVQTDVEQSLFRSEQIASRRDGPAPG